MQRLVQEWFCRQNLPLKTMMELNTLDAFRGVVRQGEIIALLPESALIEAAQDHTLAIRSLEELTEPLTAKLPQRLTRQVVLATTSDRLQIPPIRHFCDLVKQQMPR